MKDALFYDYGIKELPQLIYDNQGKPLLKDQSDIHFSLSHCREAVACALSDQPIGVDIETMEHFSVEVAEHVMSEKEMFEIKASPLPALTFTRLWTMKESLFKLTDDDHGGDIRHMLDDTSQVRFQTWDYPLFVVTACCFSHSDSLNLSCPTCR